MQPEVEDRVGVQASCTSRAIESPPNGSVEEANRLLRISAQGSELAFDRHVDKSTISGGHASSQGESHPISIMVFLALTLSVSA